DAGRRRANQIIEDIYRNTAPHKDVVVETFAEVPRGQKPDAFTEERFRSRTVDGLMVVAVKRQKKLVITVGRRTEDRFSTGDARRMRELMLARFGKKDFDGGLIEGLEFAQRSLKSAFPASAGIVRSAPPPLRREYTPPPQRYVPRSEAPASSG